jgi:hypothetical protein
MRAVGQRMMAQPTVTVLPARKPPQGSTLLFGAVVLAVFVHRLGTWGFFDPTAYVRFVPQPLLGMSLSVVTVSSSSYDTVSCRLGI